MGWLNRPPAEILEERLEISLSRLKCIKANTTVMPVPKQPTIRRSKRGDEKELKNIIGDDGT